MSKKDNTFSNEEAWKIINAITKKAEESYIGEGAYLSAFKLGWLQGTFSRIIMTLDKRKYEIELTQYLSKEK